MRRITLTQGRTQTTATQTAPMSVVQARLNPARGSMPSCRKGRGSNYETQQVHTFMGLRLTARMVAGALLKPRLL